MNTMAFIRRGNMHECLSLDIICSWILAVFLELRSLKTALFALKGHMYHDSHLESHQLYHNMMGKRFNLSKDYIKKSRSRFFQ